MRCEIAKYDLVLVFTAFQRNCIYAAIVKELSASYRIAILPLSRKSKTQSRIGKTNCKFLNLCMALGADVIVDGPVSARVEILAQSDYSEEDVVFIQEQVRADKTFWLSGVAMGNAFFKNLYGKNIDKVLVPDLDFYNYRITSYSDDGVRFEDHMISEIGMPYKKYPIFSDLPEMAWVLANPTPFSFVTAEDRLHYLENVLYVCKKIREMGENIIYKPHNADERSDYIVNRYLYKLCSSFLGWYIAFTISSVLAIMNRLLPGRIMKPISDEILVAIVYRKIMKLVVPLSQITPYYNLNLEVFLPHVTKGLITGRSNSIWHGLLLKKLVINCVPEGKPYFSEEKMHKFAMRYYDVHWDPANLFPEEVIAGNLSDRTREADLIAFLREELA